VSQRNILGMPKRAVVEEVVSGGDDGDRVVWRLCCWMNRFPNGDEGELDVVVTT